ncbi:uncharacterized protein METZ01_LOCUS420235, partial [marine metagenome]
YSGISILSELYRGYHHRRGSCCL